MSDDIFLMGEDRTSSYVVFTLANCCMPTLVKSKPSSLVSFSKRYIDSMPGFFKTLLRESESFGCSYRILCECKKSIYIIIYNNSLLQDVVRKNIDNPLFSDNGYRKASFDLEDILKRLRDRYAIYQNNKEIGLCKDFPQEIGIILGYPVADVEEYIKNNGENYALCGYWKVYHNVEEAERIFSLFTKIRHEAIGLFYAGRPLQEITC